MSKDKVVAFQMRDQARYPQGTECRGGIRPMRAQEVWLATRQRDVWVQGDRFGPKIRFNADTHRAALRVLAAGRLSRRLAPRRLRDATLRNCRRWRIRSGSDADRT